MTNKEAIKYLIRPVATSTNLDNEYLKQKEAYDLAIKALEERPTGEWIYTDIEDKRKGYGGYCSICKCDMPIFMEDWKHKYCETSYCPNCGAKMKGDNNNDK